MSLLSILSKLLTQDSSVQSISGNSGLSKSQIRMLIAIALPILIKYLTKNASSQSGAQSLLGALTQHTSTNDVGLQLKDADLDDGNKIVNHILGDNTGKVVDGLSAQTGIDQNMVSSVLSNIAPVLLSGLSAAQTETAPQANNSTDFLTSFAGSLFGSKPAQSDDSDFDGTDLLQLLFSAK